MSLTERQTSDGQVTHNHRIGWVNYDGAWLDYSPDDLLLAATHVVEANGFQVHGMTVYRTNDWKPLLAHRSTLKRR